VTGSFFKEPFLKRLPKHDALSDMQYEHDFEGHSRSTETAIFDRPCHFLLVVCRNSIPIPWAVSGDTMIFQCYVTTCNIKKSYALGDNCVALMGVTRLARLAFCIKMVHSTLISVS